MTIVSLLERFGGYTLSSLMAEDPELFRYVRLADREREVNGGERNQNLGPDSELY